MTEVKISGYQVLDKWLKDRKGRELSHDDIQAYLGIVTAFILAEQVAGDIDAAMAVVIQ